MSEYDTREIAINLSSTYEVSELLQFDVSSEAKREGIPLDVMNEAVKMALTYLQEDYW